MTKKKFNKQLGSVLKDHRKYLGLSQQVVAKKVGIHQTALSLVENGKQELTTFQFAKICDVFEKHLDTVIFEVEISQ